MTSSINDFTVFNKTSNVLNTRINNKLNTMPPQSTVDNSSLSEFEFTYSKIGYKFNPKKLDPSITILSIFVYDTYTTGMSTTSSNAAYLILSMSDKKVYYCTTGPVVVQSISDWFDSADSSYLDQFKSTADSVNIFMIIIILLIVLFSVLITYIVTRKMYKKN